MESIIECEKRIYIIRIDDVKIHIESDRPLSLKTTEKLLEEDIDIKDIGSILEKHKILNIEKVIEEKPNQIVENDYVYSNLKNQKELNPLQRLNILIGMKGIFSRIEYQKYLENNFRIKVSDSIGHKDIANAILLRKIKPVEERKPTQFVKYKVVDSNPVNENAYKLISAKEKRIK